jgi:hypothetical protein
LSILDYIMKIAGEAGPELVALLNSLKAKYPDAAAEIDKTLAALTVAVDPANLVAVGQSVLSELSQVAQGNLDGRRHPSDAA